MTAEIQSEPMARIANHEYGDSNILVKGMEAMALSQTTSCSGRARPGSDTVAEPIRPSCADGSYTVHPLAFHSPGTNKRY